MARATDLIIAFDCGGGNPDLSRVWGFVSIGSPAL